MKAGLLFGGLKPARKAAPSLDRAWTGDDTGI